MATIITSLQNSNLKATIKLRDKRARQKTKTFLVEGAREIERALECSFDVNELYFAPTLLSKGALNTIELIKFKNNIKQFELNEQCFAKLAVREGSDGLVAVFKQKQYTLEGISLSKKSILVALEQLEKPGNLGAVLRSADGAGVDAVIVLEESVDQYNPNVIRTSLGTVFSIPVIHASNQGFYDFIKKNKIKSYAAALIEGTKNYSECDYSNAVAFLLGNEAKGLSSFWLEKSDETVSIPMKGIADSLNVSVAASLLIYEALRQRQ